MEEIWKEGLILIYYPGTGLKALRKTTGNLRIAGLRDKI
jgi:hypothetical protein